MFLHLHKLTTELFNSIKTQQINVFNASVDSNANCLCHIHGAIKSAALQTAALLSGGSCVAGQWFLWLRRPMKSLRRRRHRTCPPAVLGVRADECLIVRWFEKGTWKLMRGDVTYWLLWRLLWCCATCPSRGPAAWPAWSSHRPRWCWTASPCLCADRWNTCKDNQSSEIRAKTLCSPLGVVANRAVSIKRNL